MHYNFSQLLKRKLEKEMAAILADNVEEEYLWATSLTSANKVQHVLHTLNHVNPNSLKLYVYVVFPVVEKIFTPIYC